MGKGTINSKAMRRSIDISQVYKKSEFHFAFIALVTVRLDKNAFIYTLYIICKDKERRRLNS